jgi:hypothetical protein
LCAGCWINLRQEIPIQDLHAVILSIAQLDKLQALADLDARLEKLAGKEPLQGHPLDRLRSMILHSDESPQTVVRLFLEKWGDTLGGYS